MPLNRPGALHFQLGAKHTFGMGARVLGKYLVAKSIGSLFFCVLVMLGWSYI